ncbi:MAG: decarboxylase [Candidatus Aenigmatarchaeota archaeon]|nr:decarboxylase [Candidatus Aenigmarchaeota archaeon]
MARFILSRKKVLEQYRILSEITDIVGYNFKANKEVGKIIEKETNAPIVISSLNSIKEIEEKSRIIYILQGNNLDEIKSILKDGVKTFIVDNESDLKRLLSLEKEINLFVRMKVREHTIYTGKYFVYGFHWKRLQELITKLRKNKNIKELGIHFHRKTQNVGEWFLKEEFNDVLTEDVTSAIDIINIGGGIPVEYANSKPNIEVILEKIKEFKDFVNSLGIKLAIEPGRFIAAPPIKLEANVINAYEDNLILDCSVYNTCIDIILMNVKLLVEGEKESGRYKYILKGYTPDSMDIFRYKVFFDEEKKIGDKIVFINAGAYNFYTEFNDLPRVPTIIVD